MLIENTDFDKNSLSGKRVIVTGAAGGIGFETAKAFCYLGAHTAIVDINRQKCVEVETHMKTLHDSIQFEIYNLDLANEDELESFVKKYQAAHGCPDIIINNAARVIIGATEELSTQEWDMGYKINLKAPVLLTKYFLPEMKKRNSGVICFVPSSGAAPFMGAYEVFKTAQTEFCNTLCAELENTAIFCYSLAPGLVKTQSAAESIEKVAQLMQVSAEGIYSSNEKNMLTAEEAGTAFAIAAVCAEKYNGMEIGAIQVLNDYQILKDQTSDMQNTIVSESTIKVINDIYLIFMRQHIGWMERNIFERQWLLRDFKKKTGYTPQQMEDRLKSLTEQAAANKKIDTNSMRAVLENLKTYYENQYTLLQGWEKDSAKLKENSEAIQDWIDDINQVLKALAKLR